MLLIIVALITDHCCKMIIVCKREAVRITCERRGLTNIKDIEAVSLSFQYGEVGRVAVGRWGKRLVDTALVFTQFGFCTAYLIFLGDTIHALAPEIDLVVSSNLWRRGSNVPNDTPL